MPPPPPPPEGTNWPPKPRLEFAAKQTPTLPGFNALLRQAIAELSVRGYTDPARINWWIDELRAAAQRELPNDAAVDDALRRGFGALYAGLIERGKIAKQAPAVNRYTLAMVRPELRAELDRRILAAADLIKLRRKDAIEKTLARFQGWSTSIPAGGAGVIDKREVRADIAKSVAQFKWEQRRVAVDQGHKLTANVADIVAKDSGAIAGIWHSHWRQRGYDYRKDHKERDLRVYAVRGSWAAEAGLINKGAGYLDEMTAAGQEPFCRCYIQYVSSPRELPEEMLTAKGRAWVQWNKSGERAAA